MNRNERKEGFTPLANLGPEGGHAARVRYVARLIADLQVYTVVRDVTPWLQSRSGSLLEVGCGDQPYRYLIPDNCRYIGLDIQSTSDSFGTRSEVQLVKYSGDIFPFNNNSFESVFHTETLEHVYNFNVFISECARVLKIDGSMLFTIPFQARFHYIPYDYWRFTPTALIKLLQNNGFSEITVSPRGSDIVVAAYKVVSVCYRLIFAVPILLPVIFPVIFLLLVVAHTSLRLRWGSQDDCLGYTVSARRNSFE